jgi:hypothetical protein
MFPPEKDVVWELGIHYDVLPHKRNNSSNIFTWDNKESQLWLVEPMEYSFYLRYNIPIIIIIILSSIHVRIPYRNDGEHTSVDVWIESTSPSQSLVFEINPAQQQPMRNNKRMLCTISRKLKRSEHLYFGSKIAASRKLPYEADTVAVEYCAPKTVWEQNGWISHVLHPILQRCGFFSFSNGVILRHRTTDVTVRQMMISMILITTSIPISFFNGWIIVVVVMENILVLASCPNHLCCPLLPNPLPLPSDDGTIQQSTNNQPNLNSNWQNCDFMNHLTLYRLTCLQRDAYDVRRKRATCGIITFHSSGTWTIEREWTVYSTSVKPCEFRQFIHTQPHGCIGMEGMQQKRKESIVGIM